MDTGINDLLVKARAKIVQQSAKVAAASGDARAAEETVLLTMRTNLVQREIQVLMSSDEAVSSLSGKIAGGQTVS